jgi:CheY-like chemotaxis protein
MFDEYTRFNLEANRTTVGTGLGMTITSNLIKLMEGQFWVDSMPGKGTVFTIRIPQEIIGSDVLGREIAEKLQSFYFANQMRDRHSKIVRERMPYGKILVVDDIPSNMDVAKLLLNPYGLQIDTAESGFEAIDLIKEGKEYDIVFMDHMMPKMDGMETTRKIRELGYKLPILALTANAVSGQKDIFLASGFNGYISKPIDIRQLNDSLNKFIRNKERSRRLTEAPAESAYHTYIEGETFMLTTINIPGVDVETGLALYGEDQDIYLSVLRSFLPNILTIIEKLRNVSEESLYDYTINVHGLKSICAGIGAEKVRGTAYDLEMKAKSGDLSGVLAGNESLLKEAAILASEVRIWLEEHDNKNPKQKLARPDKELLIRLRKSCEAYDVKNIDDIMDKLESVGYETDASLITWLRERIDASDFSSVASRLSEYEEESK